METPRALPHDIWEQLPPAAQAYIEELEARVETLASMIDALEEQVRMLEEQLHQTSGHSSRPPATAPPPTPRPPPSSESTPSWWSTGPVSPYPYPCARGRSR